MSLKEIDCGCLYDKSLMMIHTTDDVWIWFDGSHSFYTFSVKHTFARILMHHAWLCHSECY